LLDEVAVDGGRGLVANNGRSCGSFLSAILFSRSWR
jgi:hypothetical protein